MQDVLDPAMPFLAPILAVALAVAGGELVAGAGDGDPQPASSAAAQNAEMTVANDAAGRMTPSPSEYSVIGPFSVLPAGKLGPLDPWSSRLRGR